mmetsp:Transcript_6033/g.13899  ORF Transcript_6033/g.13899 Transcript_6033/m.13899 type:complete len:200 (-) Transcript_6033:1062-1661(-)
MLIASEILAVLGYHDPRLCCLLQHQRVQAFCVCETVRLQCADDFFQIQQLIVVFIPLIEQLGSTLFGLVPVISACALQRNHERVSLFDLLLHFTVMLPRRKHPRRGEDGEDHRKYRVELRKRALEDIVSGMNIFRHFKPCLYDFSRFVPLISPEKVQICSVQVRQQGVFGSIRPHYNVRIILLRPQWPCQCDISLVGSI